MQIRLSYHWLITSLFLFSSIIVFGQVNYPKLQRFTKPYPGITAPGDPFSPLFSGEVQIGTPQVAEWTRTAGPNESLVLTGSNFSGYSGSEEGKDTRFTIYAFDGINREAMIQKIDKDKAVITLNKNLPRWSMYLIWPGNEAGYGAPIAVNKTDGWWLGPDKASRGDTISVFGRNLSQNNDTISSYVYIKPVSSAGQWVKVVNVNPYKVDFIVPANLANGDYEVWTHNGHGGEYGWSSPLKLTIYERLQWSTAVFNVKNYGAKGDGVSDDIIAIKNTLVAARNSPGAMVYFPTGTYMVSSNLEAASNTRWKGDGRDKSIIKCRTDYSSTASGLVFGGVTNFEMMDMGFDGNKSFRGYHDKPIMLRGSTFIRIKNVRFSFQNYGIMDLHLARYIFIENTEHIGMVLFLGNCSQLFINKNDFLLTNDTDHMIHSWAGEGISLTNSTCRDYNNSDPNNGAGWGKGRFFVGQGAWGTNRMTYLGNNVTTDLTPRPATDQNSGEQFMWEGNFAEWAGYSSGATASTATLNGYFNSYQSPNVAVIVKGKGMGQSRRIILNSGSTVTLNEPWNVIPDNTSYIIVGKFVDRIVCYNNYLDGKAYGVTAAHGIAATGIEPFGGAFNFIADKNILNELRQGIMNWSTQHSVGFDPAYFSLYSNNKMINCRIPMANYAGTTLDAPSIIGTTFRNNIVQNALEAGVYNQMLSNSFPVLDAGIYEGNTFSGVPLGFYSIHTGMQNQMLYQNNFQGTVSAVTGSAKMGLRENSYSGFISKYIGTLPDAVIEAPFHVIELNAPVNGTSLKVPFELWNSGVSTLKWTAKSSVSWISISAGIGSIATEKENSLIELIVNPQGLTAGTHKGYLTVTAGSQTKVYTIILTVGVSDGGAAPIVSLTSPSNGSNFTAPATITLTANASDVDGTISKVEFFNGSTKLGEDLTSPYSFVWNGVAEGAYSITAKATDNGGLSATSASANIEVKSNINLAPSVSLSSPSNGSNFTAPATITLTADASDGDGTIGKVEFFNGSTRLGEDLTSPYSFVWNGVAEGTYNISAKATDNGGLSTTSASASITGIPGSIANSAPVINFTSPSNGSTFTAPASITLTASASDGDGTISKVEFFNGSTKLGEDLTAPYSFVWNGVAEGTYSITAKATDNGGLSITTEAVNIEVNDKVTNTAPVVNLTSPSNGSNFTALATITLTADASDVDGSISKVEFFNGSTKLGEDLTSPYSFVWNGVASGNYFITAKATDNGGLSTTSQNIHLKVKGSSNLAPSVVLTSPSNGSNFTAPATTTLTADASDVDGTISKVEFFNGSTKLGEDLTAPYSFVWNGVAEGNYSISAKATDNSGLSSTSRFIDIVVTKDIANLAPSVVLTAPSNGSNFTIPATITLTADASDVDGTISKVEFFNGSTKLGEDLTAPYSFVWNGVASGNYFITAKAIDNGGLTVTSQSKSITASDGIANLAPSVVLTAPSNGSNFTVPATITLTADASDVDGTISKVEFFNGSTKLGEDLTAPYSFVWNGVASGNYFITAKAIDNGGLTVTSQTTTVEVNSPINLAPTVNLTSPSNGSNFTAPASITLTATASDADGIISKVEFFSGSTKLGEDLSSPYSFVWNGVAEENYSITAKATDNGGLNTTSQTANVAVKSPINLAPSVNLTSPSNGSNFTALAAITLAASASDVDGTISKVEFFNGSTKMGEDLTAPYSFVWNNVPEGNYSITAKTTDNGGLSTTSQSIEITASNGTANLAPSVSLTSPSNGSNFTAPASITLTATASDGDGTISKVEFFNGSTKLGEDLSSPYSFVWNGVAEGTYSITAKATDNGGLSATSYSIYVTVATSIANMAPVISLTSPSNGSNFTAPATITLTANASDADGTISKVEFFNGSTRLGEDLTAPYSFVWNGVAEGTYSITAKATDNGGLSTASASPTITVQPAAPTVSLVSLTRGNFTAPANVIFTAVAYDSDGLINKVEFFAEGVKIGEATSAPYTFTWNNVAPGLYRITAKATDNSGLNTISAPMDLVVFKPNVPPTVKITAPENKSHFGNTATINISASASATEATIVKVEFFSGNIKLGEDITSPYNFDWTNVPVGAYTLIAKATDDNGLSGFSDTVMTMVGENEKLSIYPNPYASVTTIQFSLSKKAFVELKVYNALGSLMETVHPGIVEANMVNQIRFDGTHLAAGTYFCRLFINDGVSYFKSSLEAKMLIIR